MSELAVTGSGRDVDHTPQAASLRLGILGVLVVLTVAVVGLLWAKWLPYTDRALVLSDSATWPGAVIFETSGAPGATPTLEGAFAFSGAYFSAVWRAALLAVVLAAAIEAFVPRAWLVRVLTRRTPLSQGVAGGLLSMPSMMCSCCTSPVAVGMRRRGVPIAASVAYWLGNPLLNPAVLLFLVLVLPWQVAAVRAVVAVLVVLGAAVLATRMVGGDGIVPGSSALAPDDPRTAREMLSRFVSTLTRYAVIIVPEYLILVFLTGWLSGWLADWTGLSEAAGPLALLLVGIVGSLLVIPTGGEIPVVVGLMAAGVGAGVAGVLLITLPALSVASMVMVGRAFSWRVTAALAGVVVLGGLLAGGLLVAMPPA